jgi:hypothetical protein
VQQSGSIVACARYGTSYSASTTFAAFESADVAFRRRNQPFGSRQFAEVLELAAGRVRGESACIPIDLERIAADTS